MNVCCTAAFANDLIGESAVDVFKWLGEQSLSATKQETECKMGMQGFICIEVSRVCSPPKRFCFPHQKFTES